MSHSDCLKEFQAKTNLEDTSKRKVDSEKCGKKEMLEKEIVEAIETT